MNFYVDDFLPFVGDVFVGWICELKINQLEIKKGHLRFIESETLLFQSTASLIEI